MTVLYDILRFASPSVLSNGWVLSHHCGTRGGRRRRKKIKHRPWRRAGHRPNKLGCPLSGLLNGTWTIISSSTYNWSIGFQALLLDQESQVIYNRNRLLHSKMGRFTGRDPHGYRDGPNLYQYLRSKPTTSHDPLGLGTQLSADISDCAEKFQSCLTVANADLDACRRQWATCTQSVIPAFGPLSSDASECNQYPCDYEYAGANARCFCKCAGNSRWSQYVRGCLSELFNDGINAQLAHLTCYNMGDAFSGGVMPQLTLLWCWATC